MSAKALEAHASSMILSTHRFRLLVTAALVVSLLGCAPKGEDAKKKLELMGLEYSQASFFNAVSEGRSDLVALFLGAGFDIRGKLLTNTPLMLASMRGHTELVGLLLDRGAEIDARNGKNYTALMLAMEHGAPSELIELLRSRGGTVQPARDIDKFAMKRSDVNFKEGMFVVDAQLENKSIFASLYPSLALTLTNSIGIPIEKRLFHPGQYITGEGAAADRLAAKTTTSVKITTPKLEKAVNYELELFYPDR